MYDMNALKVYCCSCNCLLPREQAQQIFQTGYYKIVFPLGVCVKCANDESSELMFLPGLAKTTPIEMCAL